MPPIGNPESTTLCRFPLDNVSKNIVCRILVITRLMMTNLYLTLVIVSIVSTLILCDCLFSRPFSSTLFYSPVVEPNPIHININIFTIRTPRQLCLVVHG